MDKKVRVNTEITEEADQVIEAFMKRAGLTKAKACALSIQLGSQALRMAFDPNWKAFFEANMRLDDEKK